MDLTKTLAITLRAFRERWQITFRMEVPANVFAMAGGELLIRPAPGTQYGTTLAVEVMRFAPGTDGVVDVSASVRNISFPDLRALLEGHTQVTDLQVKNA